jgi:hypothetical protein
MATTGSMLMEQRAASGNTHRHRLIADRTVNLAALRLR